MNMEITLTKCAAAYQDLIFDTEVTAQTYMIQDVVSVPKHLGIGNAIIFLTDGTTLNVIETPEEVQKQLEAVKCLFQFGFSKN
jgi:hypothetical protein